METALKMLVKLALSKGNLTFCCPFSGETMMLEADVSLGTLVTHPEAEPFPIMAHPPDTTSGVKSNYISSKSQTILKLKKTISSYYKWSSFYELNVIKNHQIFP